MSGKSLGSRRGLEKTLKRKSRTLIHCFMLMNFTKHIVFFLISVNPQVNRGLVVTCCRTGGNSLSVLLLISCGAETKIYFYNQNDISSLCNA